MSASVRVLQRVRRGTGPRKSVRSFTKAGIVRDSAGERHKNAAGAERRAVPVPVPVPVLNKLKQLFRPSSPWAQRLEAAQQTEMDCVSSTRSLPLRRIAIVGASPEFMDTFLADPLDERVTRTIETYPRHKQTRIMYGQGGWTAEGVWTLPLSWLRGTELIEIRADLPDTDQTYTALLACDAVYFVVSAHELAESMPRVQSILRLANKLSTKPHTALLVDCEVDSAYGQHALAQWDAAARIARKRLDPDMLTRFECAALPLENEANSGVRFVSSSLARLAQSILPSEGMPEFTRIFRASRFASLYPMLQADYLPSERVEHVARMAFHAASGAEADEGARLKAAEGWASLLESEAKHDIETLSARLAPLADAPPPRSDAPAERRGDRSSVTRSNQVDARAMVESTMKVQFPWWRLLSRVDEVRHAVTYAVSKSFGTHDETRLAYEAGRLRGVAAEQRQRTEKALDDIHTKDVRPEEERGACADQPSLDSATLRNAVASYGEQHLGALLHAHCLSEPILERRAQLLARNGPIEQLVRRAQSAVMTTYIGLGTSYTMCALGLLAHAAPEPVAQPKSTMQEAVSSLSWLPNIHVPSWTESIAMTPPTAGGAALLATAAFAYLLQGRWSRAKRAFWHDWDRTVEATEREQEECIAAVLRTQVYGAPLHVARALREQMDSRLASHEARRKELRAIREHFSDRLTS